MIEKKYKCIKCQAEILEATFKANNKNCYKCRRRISNDPDDLKVQLFFNIIFGAVASMVSYFNWGVIASIAGFIVGFFVGKVFNFVTARFDLDE